VVPGDGALGLPAPGQLPAVVGRVAWWQEGALHAGRPLEIPLQGVELVLRQAFEADAYPGGDVEELWLDRHVAGGADGPASVVQPVEGHVDAVEEIDQAFVVGRGGGRREPFAPVDQPLAERLGLRAHGVAPDLRSRVICPPW